MLGKGKSFKALDSIYSDWKGRLPLPLRAHPSLPPAQNFHVPRVNNFDRNVNENIVLFLQLTISLKTAIL